MRANVSWPFCPPSRVETVASVNPPDHAPFLNPIVQCDKSTIVLGNRFLIHELYLLTT